MKKLSILVATHKPVKFYTDDVYTPIHVGRAVSQYKEEMADMVGDDTGENISAKNRSYCELSAIYWAWKNLKDVEYVGLAHYRRYFETKFTAENIDDVFKHCDVVLAKPFLHDFMLEFKLARKLALEDETILLAVIKMLYPEYEKSVLEYLYDFADYSCNMFVMKREQFDGYCEFLFSILEECEKYMRDSRYTCSTRRMGYIGEFLLPIYCLHNKMRIREENIVPNLGEHPICANDWKQRLKIKLLHIIYDKHRPKTFDEFFDLAVLIGLKTDGILGEGPDKIHTSRIVP